MSRTILMLEDDEDDRYLSQAIFDENHSNVVLEIVSKRADLDAYLRKSASGSVQIPALVLLDYHMDAVDILKSLKSDARFKHIPVVVLSGAVHPDVIKECYALGASSFIQKPSDKVEEKISKFIRYWFEVAELA
jgi:CheY-like chemotaxis protein